MKGREGEKVRGKYRRRNTAGGGGEILGGD